VGITCHYIDYRSYYVSFTRLIAAEATTGRNATFQAALAVYHDLGRTRGIDAALKQFKLDALVLPAPGLTTVPAGKHVSQHSILVNNLYLQPLPDILS
jgi:hypothetical protein